MAINPGDYRRLRQELERQDWRVDDRGVRWLAYSPDGQMIVTIHLTPSDHRAWRNTISRLRRGGFDPDA